MWLNGLNKESDVADAEDAAEYKDTHDDLWDETVIHQDLFSIEPECVENTS